MDTEHILAMKSAGTGNIHLFDETDDFMASFYKGKWIADTVFDYADLQENFDHMTDDDEILRLLAEARAALGREEKKAKAG